ncbi:acetate/propionate family kinase [Paucibacter sp. TC2R-5]|uniref:acetate/propionate family kinase n=1 Tax=Paucibacter sp. TC2R-5 TaxID=2893555 RepID=UPI0021E4FE17|nr:acetate/propionate family kinase [Paucibacter sp. TC2R-5]MCV2358235.1 acetate/propionate family kinase [Paucibacter sp. TC2R-5]
MSLPHGSSHDALLVLNAGSSSLKFSVYRVDADEQLHLLASGGIEELGAAAHFWAKNSRGELLGEQRWPGPAPAPAPGPLGHSGAIDFLTEWLREHNGGGMRLIGVGHRVVHGGLSHSAPELVTTELLSYLQSLVPLAPLHQPHNLLAIRLIAQRLPGLPQVACFDTAFHRTAPAVSQAFALPPTITAKGVRRYGFHGLSYEYIARALPDYDAQAAAGRTVVLHLGNGASMCAMQACKSVASSMGFTAVDGLVMGSRCGSLDPGVLLYLMDELKMDARAVERLLYKESGLLGVSGISSDMRALSESQDPRAIEAIELFVYRIGRELGSLAAALGGLDAIVFTAGIGEHSAPVRAAICRAAAWLGVELDEAANLAGGPRISTTGSRCAAWVIPTNEELTIARHCLALLSQQEEGTRHEQQHA